MDSMAQLPGFRSVAIASATPSSTRRRAFAPGIPTENVVPGRTVPIVDEPANARKHDAMSAMEYLVSYVYNSPEPYIEPSRYSSGSPAYRKAQQMLAKWKRKGEQNEYCHIGPGEAA